MSVVAKGVVTIKVQGLLRQKQIPGSWGQLFDGGGDRLPRIVMFDEEGSHSSVHTVQLEHLKFSDKSYRQQDLHFVLSIKKEKHQFHFERMQDKDDWVQGLCHVSPELWKQRASALESSDFDDGDSVQSMQENYLYDSCDKVYQFKVSINPTKASEANNLQGHYLLNPTATSVRLMDMITFKCIHEWPYKQIRKYGRTRNIFRMEVGRRCTTGEGEFEFFTPEGSSLTELISVYTRQPQNEISRQQYEGASSAEDSVNTSPRQHSQPAPFAHRTSEKTMEPEGAEQPPQRSSTISLGSKHDIYEPAASSELIAKRENSSAMLKPPNYSDDTKIYETSTGLTAPLNSSFKHELVHTLNAQLSVDSEDGTPSCQQDDINDNTDLKLTESSLNRQDSSRSIKEKKKNDKDKKKREKEQKAAEAKLKKQQEKELKEQKEREARELKELEKKQKKDSKGHAKLLGKKSNSQQQASRPLSSGHIYDEPGDLLQESQTARLPEDSAYAEADEIKKPSPKIKTECSQHAGNEVLYATPEKPKKDSWKKHGLAEFEDIHQENYDNIKMASLSKATAHPPHLPAQLSGKDSEDDTYDRLGEFNQQSAPLAENIYGLASAVETVRAKKPIPYPVFASGSEYEEADPVRDSLDGEQTGVGSQKRMQQTLKGSININIPSEGEYADVS